jgi:pyridoxine/pyridoxamine 5'-phosphate oxidase
MIDAMELWVEGEYRIHDRARWTRTLAPTSGPGGPADLAAVWTATRLQP